MGMAMWNETVTTCFEALSQHSVGETT